MAGAIAGAVVGGLLGRVAVRIRRGTSPGRPLPVMHTENGNVVGGASPVAGTLSGSSTFVGLPSGVLGGVLYALLRAMR